MATAAPGPRTALDLCALDTLRAMVGRTVSAGGRSDAKGWRETGALAPDGGMLPTCGAVWVTF